MMKEKNGHYYSSNSFPEYEYRYVFSFELDRMRNTIHVYTTNDDTKEVCGLINLALYRKHRGANNFKLEHKASAEQDRLTEDFLNDFFKDNEL